jgi:tight adherence protein C
MGPHLLLYLGVGAFVVGLAVATGMMLSAKAAPTGVARSLALIEHGLQGHEVARNELGVADRLATPLLDLTRRLAVSVSPKGTASRLTKLLDSAGNPPTWTVERVLGVKGAALILLGALGLMIFGGLTPMGLLAGVVLAAAGFFLPDLLIKNAGMKRQEELRRGLADALDMLTVCVEAGQGFDGALQQVSRSVTGPVAGEFARVLQEIQIGRPRGQAFSSLAARTTVPEIKTFVTALVQADRLGLPIGSVLREQAQQMRLVRKQRAEELAMKVPVKILFPLMLCILPALFIVIIGPGGIRMMDTFSQM